MPANATTIARPTERTRTGLGAATILALCALAVRIVWLLVQGQTEISWDGAEYARTASNLLHGVGYIGMHGGPTWIFPPLYPVLIAAVMLLVHNGETAGIIVSLLAGAALVFPVFGIAARMYGRGAGLIAGTIVAFLPFAVDMSILVLSDSLFLLLAAAALYALIRTLDEGRLVDAAWSGTAFGLAYLTRPEGFVLGAAGLAAIGCGWVLLPHLRRRLALGAVAFTVLLALVMSPYVIFLSAHAGTLKIEAKSAVNATIAERMRAGLGYTQAADELDDKLNIIGPEIDDDEYFVDRWVVQPALGERISLMLSDARQRLGDVPRTLVSKAFGTPLLALAVLAGFAFGPWTRRRVVLEIALVGYVIALFASLTTVYHFWARYAFGFTPILAIWAAHGFDALARKWRPSAAVAVSAVLAVAFLIFLPGMRASFRDTVNDSTPLTERTIGLWLGAYDPAAGHILTVSDQSVYYANGTWSMLPYVSRPEIALAYAALKAPRYLVLDRWEAEQRPYIAQWLDHGVPDRRAKLVHVFGNPRSPDGAIYRWDGSS